MISQILAGVNAILAAILCVFALRYLYKSKTFAKWVKIATALIGAYWCGLYIFVMIASPENYNPVTFGQTFVRPAFTLTLAVMAGGAIYRWRSYD